MIGGGGVASGTPSSCTDPDEVGKDKATVASRFLEGFGFFFFSVPMEFVPVVEMQFQDILKEMSLKKKKEIKNPSFKFKFQTTQKSLIGRESNRIRSDALVVKTHINRLVKNNNNNNKTIHIFFNLIFPIKGTNTDGLKGRK